MSDLELTAAQGAVLVSWVNLESDLSYIGDKTWCGGGRRRER
jgi:hypothetical protein